MLGRLSKLVLTALTATLMLGGCATTGSVKRAQATGNQALSWAQDDATAARKAQSSADNANAAAERAQATADAAANRAEPVKEESDRSNPALRHTAHREHRRHGYRHNHRSKGS